jgi:hypothetical protein
MSDFPLADRALKGGAVVVTLFACRKRRDILLIWWLHHRIKPAVQARTRGFLGVRLYIDWRRRIVRSVSLWTDVAYLYDMGEVREHVAVARIPRQLSIRTTCGIYTYEGEWSELMFGLEPNQKPNPLADTNPSPAERAV